MRFWHWVRIKLLGFDPAKYEEKMKVLVDGASHQVADMIIEKEKLKETIRVIKEDLPEEEWFGAVQNAIKILDERTEHHQECFEHLFSEADDITMTPWGIVSNNKQNN